MFKDFFFDTLEKCWYYFSLADINKIPGMYNLYERTNLGPICKTIYFFD